jgi:glycogen(starch) synthase
MRLLMTADTVGGVWTYTRELVQGLLKAGDAVALVTLGRTPTPVQARWLLETAAEWGQAFAWQATETPLEWMSNNQQAYADAEWVLLRLAEEFGVELLHSNQFCFGALPLPVSRLVVAHSDVLSWSMACSHPLESSPWFDQYRGLVSTGLRGADALVAPTQWMLEAFAAGFDVPCETYVQANGRTLRGFAPSTHRKLQAVTAGRLWDEAKNLKILSGVTLPLPLFVAGEDTYELHASPILPRGAVALGSLDEDDLLDLFRQSAVYLCTSRYEPFGLAPLEAAMCGCAVLAHDIPSLREVWGDGALYYSNAAELTGLLHELVGDPQRLGAAQRRSSHRAQRFTGESMTNRYKAIYRTILSRAAVTEYVA